MDNYLRGTPLGDGTSQPVRSANRGARRDRRGDGDHRDAYRGDDGARRTAPRPSRFPGSRPSRVAWHRLLERTPAPRPVRSLGGPRALASAGEPRGVRPPAPRGSRHPDRRHRRLGIVRAGGGHRRGGHSPRAARAVAAHRVDRRRLAGRSVRDDERRRALAHRRHGQGGRRRLGPVPRGKIRSAPCPCRVRQAHRSFALRRALRDRGRDQARTGEPAGDEPLLAPGPVPLRHRARGRDAAKRPADSASGNGCGSGDRSRHGAAGGSAGGARPPPREVRRPARSRARTALAPRPRAGADRRRRLPGGGGRSTGRGAPDGIRCARAHPADPRLDLEGRAASRGVSARSAPPAGRAELVGDRVRTGPRGRRLGLGILDREPPPHPKRAAADRGSHAAGERGEPDGQGSGGAEAGAAGTRRSVATAPSTPVWRPLPSLLTAGSSRSPRMRTNGRPSVGSATTRGVTRRRSASWPRL